MTFYVNAALCHVLLDAGIWDRFYWKRYFTRGRWSVGGNFLPQIATHKYSRVCVGMLRGVVLKKEVWERRSPTKWKGRLHQIVWITWTFAYKNYRTGSSCFTVVLRCCTRDNVSLFIYAALGATHRNWNEKSKSSINVTSAKKVWERVPTPKQMLERRSHNTTPLGMLRYLKRVHPLSLVLVFVRMKKIQ